MICVKLSQSLSWADCVCDIESKCTTLWSAASLMLKKHYAYYVTVFLKFTQIKQYHSKCERNSTVFNSLGACSARGIMWVFFFNCPWSRNHYLQMVPRPLFMQTMGWHTFSAKDKRVNISGFVNQIGYFNFSILSLSPQSNHICRYITGFQWKFPYKNRC